MSLKLAIPMLEDSGLYQLITFILSKAIDGTRTPLFADENNQRILIGSTVASSAPAKLEVTGDVKIVGAGSGVIIPSRDGTQNYRLIMENDGRIAADPIP